MKEENKKRIVMMLYDTLKETREGRGIIALKYSRDDVYEDEFVDIIYSSGHKRVCVSGDSGVALMRDVLRYI